jgi:hypothetical protein
MSPVAFRNSKNDLALGAEQLRAKYDGPASQSQWGEHPNHPLKDWQAAVLCKSTRVGYWDWVVTQLKLAADTNDAKTALADAEEEEIRELQAADPGNQGG